MLGYAIHMQHSHLLLSVILLPSQALCNSLQRQIWEAPAGHTQAHVRYTPASYAQVLYRLQCASAMHYHSAGPCGGS